ncbi:MAG: glycine-rich protein [Clostridia bacterium]|nr:glycine-rich protein [Clostridia bacterium]
MRKNKGISLIVLAITIVITIIIVSAVLLTTIGNINESVQKARFVNDIKSIEESINLYRTSKLAQNPEAENIPIDTSKGNAGIVDVSSLSGELTYHMESVFKTEITEKQGMLYYVNLQDLNVNINSGAAKEGGYITKNSSIIQDKETGKVFYQEGQDIAGKRWYSVYETEEAEGGIEPFLDISVTPVQEPETANTNEALVKLDTQNADTTEYSLDGENYLAYSGEFKVYENGVVYGKATNDYGITEKTASIVTIVKEPTIQINTNPEQVIENKPSGNVTVTISTTNADVVQYSFDGETYIPYSVPFVVSENGTIYAKAINTYGETESTKEIITIGDDPIVDINAKWDTGNEGNEPLLTKGEESSTRILKPMQWVGNEWREVADTSTPWYSYKTGSQYWANAQTADGSMWVWIPRFAYKITSGEHSSTAGVVDIKFIQGTGDAPQGYTLSPAFEVEPKEEEKLQLQGIWVAKFEASKVAYKDASNKTQYRVQVKPGVASWRTIALKEAVNYCINMAKDSTYGIGIDGISIDTHLIKNKEWAAVEYLTQSKYGRNGQEVWNNNNYWFKTGFAGKTVDSKVGSVLNSNTFPYNDSKYGVNASTTKNVYGIYDMSGGSAEMVAAYVDNGHKNIKYAGGVYTAMDKYFDKYPASQLDKDNAKKSLSKSIKQQIVSQNYQLLSSIAGTGIYDTSSTVKYTSGDVTAYSSWYSDYSIYSQNSAPFILRGWSRPGPTSLVSVNPHIGIFAYKSHGGYKYSVVGFRPTISIKEGIEELPDRVSDPSIYVTSKTVEYGVDTGNEYETNDELPETESTSTILNATEKVVIAYPKEAEFMYYKRWTTTAEPATWTLIYKTDSNLKYDNASGQYYYSITDIKKATKISAYCSKGPSATDSGTDYLEVRYDTVKPTVTITGPDRAWSKQGDSIKYTITLSDDSGELNEATLTQTDIADKINVKTGSSIIDESEVTKTVEADPNDIKKWYVTLEVSDSMTRNLSSAKIECALGMAEDLAGNKSALKTSTVFGIDVTNPSVTFSPNGGMYVGLNSKVTVSDSGGSGLNNSSLQYVWNVSDTVEPAEGWQAFTNGSTLASSANESQYLWIKVSDKAGNTVTTHSNLFTEDITPPDNPTMSANPTSWTSGNVTVTITYPADASKKQYSTNGTTWSNYTSGIVVTTNNTTVYSKCEDASGNQSGQSTLTVTNIDRTAPGIPTVNLNGYTSGTWTSSNVTLTFNATDSQSGIQKYQYSLDGASGWTDVTSPWVINTDGQRNIWLRAIDNVGNIGSNSSMFSVNRDTVQPVITLNGSTTMTIVQNQTYTEPGAVVTDNLDTNIQSKLVISGTVVSGTPGNYTITYNVTDSAGNVATQRTRTVSVVSGVYNFNYTGGEQSTLLTPGTYKIECWGASGGIGGNSPNSPGYGGYSVGNIVVSANETIYIYVGGSGGNAQTYYSPGSGGYNGGSRGGYAYNSSYSGGGGGGGATDIRRNGNTLSNRIIVAGGGGGTGGGTYGKSGGDGGGTSGYAGADGAVSTLKAGLGGTQTAGGSSGLYAGGVYNPGDGYLGVGGNGSDCEKSICNAGGGGGGGWYGGGGGCRGQSNSGSPSYRGGAGGGGGSGYIGGVSSGSMSNGSNNGNGRVVITRLS